MGKWRPRQAKGSQNTSAGLGLFLPHQEMPGVGISCYAKCSCLVQVPYGKASDKPAICPTPQGELPKDLPITKENTELWARGTKREMNNVFPGHRRVCFQ